MSTLSDAAADGATNAVTTPKATAAAGRASAASTSKEDERRRKLLEWQESKASEKKAVAPERKAVPDRKAQFFERRERRLEEEKKKRMSRSAGKENSSTPTTMVCTRAPYKCSLVYVDNSRRRATCYSGYPSHAPENPPSVQLVALVLALLSFLILFSLPLSLPFPYHETLSLVLVPVVCLFPCVPRSQPPFPSLLLLLLLLRRHRRHRRRCSSRAHVLVHPMLSGTLESFGFSKTKTNPRIKATPSSIASSRLLSTPRPGQEQRPDAPGRLTGTTPVSAGRAPPPPRARVRGSVENNEVGTSLVENDGAVNIRVACWPLLVVFAV